MLAALGDPSRQAIVDALADRPYAVGELAATLPLSRPAVSQHLKVLKDVGLVVDHRAGTDACTRSILRLSRRLDRHADRLRRTCGRVGMKHVMLYADPDRLAVRRS